MHRDRDFNPQLPLAAGAADLTRDLELGVIVAAMADGDEFLQGIAHTVLLASLPDPADIAYRQDVLADCLAHPDAVRQMYGVAVAGVAAEKHVRLGWVRDTPDSLLNGSVQVLGILVDILRRLRQIACRHADGFRSEGLRRLGAALAAEVDDAYLDSVEGHLRTLRFRGGVLIGATLGRGGKGAGHAVRTPRERGMVERMSPGGGPAYTFRIPDRDENGHRALAVLRGRGIRSVALALARSTDHILGFIAALRAELAFYVACLNLHDELLRRGGVVCFPGVAPAGACELAARDLYDVPLSLHLDGRAVGNDIDAGGRPLVVVTGANQGGKSTFLRSLGLAQLMMQCGMFVAAESFRMSVAPGVFTHYRREEDAGMRQGKLDEELARMSAIVDAITPGSVLLCNESFASTNEREGAEIARQVVRALVESGVRVVFVTHLYDLAHGFMLSPPGPTRFLRAERVTGAGTRYRLIEGEPLPTSFGEDSYRRVFGRPPRG